MRNTLEYPVTKDEVIAAVEFQSKAIREEDERTMRCGNMDAYLLKLVVKLLESERVLLMDVDGEPTWKFAVA